MDVRELAQEILLCSTLPSRDTGLALLEFIVQSPLPIPFTWHPLGFAHAKILSQDQMALRVHLWPCADRRPQHPLWPVHTHIFNLESLVLSGRVQNTLYNFHSTDVGPNQLYRVEYRDGGSALIATETFGDASEYQIHVAGPGEKYEVLPEMFHSSSVEEHELAATLVRTCQQNIINAWVLGGREGRPEYFYRRSPCDPGVVLKVLRSVLVDC